jgi:transmembrane sensor
MGNDRIYPDRSAIENQAAAWLVKMDGDQPLSVADIESLREWIRRSPAHKEEISSLAAFWGNNNLTELAVPLGRHERRSNKRVVGRVWSGLRGLNPVWMSVPIAALAISFLATRPVTIEPPGSTNGLYATAVGQQQTTTLVDGSVVQLNTNSQLKIDYSRDVRDVYLLQGEAHFMVAKNADRPFRVYAGSGRIQAIGTAFSIYLNDNGVTVTVTEGRVAIASLDQSTTLNGQLTSAVNDRSRTGGMPDTGEFSRNLGALDAGQSTTIRHIVREGIAELVTMDAIEFVGQQEIDVRLSWREGFLTFTGDPLEDVVAEVSRYTTFNIEITDPSVRAMKIGGRFPAGETDVLLDVLEANFGLRVTRLGYNSAQLSAAPD